MKYLTYFLHIIVPCVIAIENKDCPNENCIFETAKHLSTIDDIWLIEYQDEVQCNYIQGCPSDDRQICPMKTTNLYGAYGSIKVEGAPKIMFYDFMVGPFPKTTKLPMQGLGMFIYA